MAMTACKECNREVSDQAQSCPGCGAPTAGTQVRVEKQKRKTSPGTWAVLVAMLVGLGWYTQSRAYKDQNLPPLPIEVGFRDALLGPGMVLQVRNKSPGMLFALVKLKNPTTREEKSFRLDITGKGMGEIGHKEGWVVASGDTLEVFNDAYSTWKGSIP